MISTCCSRFACSGLSISDKFPARGKQTRMLLMAQRLSRNSYWTAFDVKRMPRSGFAVKIILAIDVVLVEGMVYVCSLGTKAM